MKKLLFLIVSVLLTAFVFAQNELQIRDDGTLIIKDENLKDIDVKITKEAQKYMEFVPIALQRKGDTIPVEEGRVEFIRMTSLLRGENALYVNNSIACINNLIVFTGKYKVRTENYFAYNVLFTDLALLFLILSNFFFLLKRKSLWFSKLSIISVTLLFIGFTFASFKFLDYFGAFLGIMCVLFFVVLFFLKEDNFTKKAYLTGNITLYVLTAGCIVMSYLK